MTVDMNNWRHKDEWRREGSGFQIVVSRHGVPVDDITDQGPHRWAIYAYIYPKHPHFDAFDGTDFWQDATQVMPLHCGCTFLRNHVDEKLVTTSIQVGCDYNHLHDDDYTFYETPEDAWTVFHDADALFAWLESRSKS